MSAKKFSWRISGASGLGALLGIVIMSALRAGATRTPGGRAMWMGALLVAMFALGFAGLQLALAVNKQYEVQRPPMRWVAFLVTCLLLFGIGAGGQYLFMYSKEQVEVPTAAGVDMVLLLDASGSMDSAGYDQPRTDAASQFVDSLSDDCRLQAISFAGTIMDRSQFLTMDAAGKQAVKTMISSIDGVGTTDFNEPLQEAMALLTAQGRPDCNKAVILLTDGQSSLDRQVVRDYVASDIRVFTIRISSAANLDSQARALADLAANTDGVDTQLTPKAGGSIDTRDMLAAFQSAFEAVSDTRVNMREDLIVYADDGITVMQFIIRLLALVLCSMVIGVGYFCRMDAPLLIGSAVMGAVTAVLVAVLEGAGYGLCVGALWLLMGTAWVFLDLRGEDRYDV